MNIECRVPWPWVEPAVAGSTSRGPIEALDGLLIGLFVDEKVMWREPLLD